MDNNQFDTLTARLADGLSRRRGLVAIATLGLGALSGPDGVGAKKKKACPPCKRRKKGKCKPQPDGTACGNGICNTGICTPCAAGKSVCAARCVDLTTDIANCGACGSACAPSQTCDRGTCVTGSGTCAVGADTCVSPGPSLTCNGNASCFCFQSQSGATRCGRYSSTPAFKACTTDADCADRGTGAFCPQYNDSCGGVCAIPC